MGRRIGPVCRLCRREGIKLFLKGIRCTGDKCAIERRNFPPGQHGKERRPRLLGYGLQLREKQRLRRVYGILENQFRRYFESFPALPLNVVYADASGTIGWQQARDTPRRRKGWGLLPASGSDPEAGWEDGLVPFDALPRAVNPELGFVATANNQPTVSSAEPFLGMDWIEGYRFARIVQALQSRADWDVSSTGKLQRTFAVGAHARNGPHDNSSAKRR